MQELIEQFKGISKEMPAGIKQKFAKIISGMLNPKLLSRSLSMYEKTIEELDKNVEPKSIRCLFWIGITKLIRNTHITIHLDGINPDTLRTDLFKQLELEIPECSNSWSGCTAFESFDIKHLGTEYQKTIFSHTEFGSTLKQNMINVSSHFFINNPPAHDNAKKIIDCLEQVFIIEDMEVILCKQLAVNMLLKEAEGNSERETRLNERSQIKEIADFARDLKRFDKPSLGSYYLKHSAKFRKSCPELAQKVNGELEQEMQAVALPLSTFVQMALIFLSHLLDSLKSCCSFEQADEDQCSSPRVM